MDKAVGIRERQLAQKEKIRRSILDAAAELFVKEGYENVSMRRIARKISYSPMSIYVYFRDKADLLDTICKDTFAKLIEHLARLEGRAGDPVGNLKASLQAYVEFGLRHPHHYQLTFMTRPAAGGEGRRQIGLEAFNCMRAGVRACVEHGKFRTNDVELASQVLWTAVHGLTSLLITYSRFPWVPQEKLISEAIESAVRGMER